MHDIAHHAAYEILQKWQLYGDRYCVPRSPSLTASSIGNHPPDNLGTVAGLWSVCDRATVARSQIGHSIPRKTERTHREPTVARSQTGHSIPRKTERIHREPPASNARGLCRRSRPVVLPAYHVCQDAGQGHGRPGRGRTPYPTLIPHDPLQTGPAWNAGWV